ncbi:MAG: zinc ribbon domain-containing protein [Treponema sp.]|jgi:putative FmdB family regulatory protein|nr:zinc ribbon domain-containing protein [Treponema sp.]
MPTYEYECKTCGHTFDVFQNMSDEPVKVCPQCGKEVRRLINGGTGVIFKGSGFYVTDKNKSSGKTPAVPQKSGTAPETTTAAAAAKPAAAAADTPGATSAPKPKTETSTA